MEQSGNIPIFNIPGTLFGNISRNFTRNFCRICWEHIMGMFHKYSTNNIPGKLFENILKNFIGNFFQIFIMGMFHDYSIIIYFPDRYIHFNKENNNEGSKFKVGHHVRIWKYKIVFAKGYLPNWSEKLFVTKKFKKVVP